MEGKDLQEFRGDLHDLYDVVGGLGIELEALNMSVRALTAHLTGEDPLRDSLYFGGPAEEGAAPEPPPWVNSSASEARDAEPADPSFARQIKSSAGSTYPPPERGSPAAATGYLVIAAIVGSVAAFVFVLYVIAS